VISELDFLRELHLLRDSFKNGSAVVLDKAVFKAILVDIKEVVDDIERIIESE